MSGASLGKVLCTLPCFATSFDAGADVGLEFTFFGCKATCRRTASLCRAVALCGAVPRASGGFQTSEYVPAPKAVGASAAVNNASPSLRTLSPLPSGLQNGFANAPQALEGSGLTGPTTRARPAPTNPSPQTSHFPAWKGSPLGPHPTTALCSGKLGGSPSRNTRPTLYIHTGFRAMTSAMRCDIQWQGARNVVCYP